MDTMNVTQKVQTGLKNWGKPGNNTYNKWIKTIFEDEKIESKGQISAILFSNLLKMANQNACLVQFNALLQISKISINYHGDRIMVKPVVSKNRVFFVKEDGKWIDGAWIFGEELNLY